MNGRTAIPCPVGPKPQGDAIKYEDIKILVHVQERELISDQKISYPTNQINTAAAFRPF